jgi:hypothetical protein
MADFIMNASVQSIFIMKLHILKPAVPSHVTLSLVLVKECAKQGF